MTSLQSHRQVWEQIPWILNGSASEAELRAAQEHLRQCADCREAFAFEQRLRDALLRAQPNVGDAEDGWQRLSARIVSSEARPPLSARLRPSATQTRWLAAAVIVEALALGAMVTTSWFTHAGRVPAGVYQTLAQPEVGRPAATIRVVLAPDMTLDQLRTLLNEAHLQVVAGPGESGVWSLAPAEDVNTVATDAALHELRQSPQVRFVEPINGATRAHSP
ncbi:MAG TPA: zf-HC2 domain-containing protein [Steroidobacteraceae bacterium]|jgi:hypothetical protein|nr:zf-HC2 domain-containing protein [Steroidobacteraceae bacterium]